MLDSEVSNLSLEQLFLWLKKNKIKGPNFDFTNTNELGGWLQFNGYEVGINSQTKKVDIFNAPKRIRGRLIESVPNDLLTLIKRELIQTGNQRGLNFTVPSAAISPVYQQSSQSNPELESKYLVLLGRLQNNNINRLNNNKTNFNADFVSAFAANLLADNVGYDFKALDNALKIAYPPTVDNIANKGVYENLYNKLHEVAKNRTLAQKQAKNTDFNITKIKIKKSEELKSIWGNPQFQKLRDAAIQKYGTEEAKEKLGDLIELAGSRSGSFSHNVGNGMGGYDSKEGRLNAIGAKIADILDMPQKAGITDNQQNEDYIINFSEKSKDEYTHGKDYQKWNKEFGGSSGIFRILVTCAIADKYLDAGKDYTKIHTTKFKGDEKLKTTVKIKEQPTEPEIPLDWKLERILENRQKNCKKQVTLSNGSIRFSFNDDISCIVSMPKGFSHNPTCNVTRNGNLALYNLPYGLLEKIKKDSSSVNVGDRFPDEYSNGKSQKVLKPFVVVGNTVYMHRDFVSPQIINKIEESKNVTRRK